MNYTEGVAMLRANGVEMGDEDDLRCQLINKIICDCTCINHTFIAKLEFSAGAKPVDTLPLYRYVSKIKNLE